MADRVGELFVREEGSLHNEPKDGRGTSGSISIVASCHWFHSCIKAHDDQMDQRIHTKRAGSRPFLGVQLFELFDL